MKNEIKLILEKVNILKFLSSKYFDKFYKKNDEELNRNHNNLSSTNESRSNHMIEKEKIANKENKTLNDKDNHNVIAEDIVITNKDQLSFLSTIEFILDKSLKNEILLHLFFEESSLKTMVETSIISIDFLNKFIPVFVDKYFDKNIKENIKIILTSKNYLEYSLILLLEGICFLLNMNFVITETTSKESYSHSHIELNNFGKKEKNDKSLSKLGNVGLFKSKDMLIKNERMIVFIENIVILLFSIYKLDNFKDYYIDINVNMEGKEKPNNFNSSNIQEYPKFYFFYYSLLIFSFKNLEFILKREVLAKIMLLIKKLIRIEVITKDEMNKTNENKNKLSGDEPHFSEFIYDSYYSAYDIATVSEFSSFQYIINFECNIVYEITTVFIRILNNYFNLLKDFTIDQYLNSIKLYSSLYYLMIKEIDKNEISEETIISIVNYDYKSFLKIFHHIFNKLSHKNKDLFLKIFYKDFLHEKFKFSLNDIFSNMNESLSNINSIFNKESISNFNTISRYSSYLETSQYKSEGFSFKNTEKSKCKSRKNKDIENAENSSLNKEEKMLYDKEINNLSDIIVSFKAILNFMEAIVKQFNNKKINDSYFSLIFGLTNNDNSYPHLFDDSSYILIGNSLQIILNLSDIKYIKYKHHELFENLCSIFLKFYYKLILRSEELFSSLIVNFDDKQKIIEANSEFEILKLTLLLENNRIFVKKNDAAKIEEIIKKNRNNLNLFDYNYKNLNKSSFSFIDHKSLMETNKNTNITLNSTDFIFIKQFFEFLNEYNLIFHRRSLDNNFDYLKLIKMLHNKFGYIFEHKLNSNTSTNTNSNLISNTANKNKEIILFKEEFQIDLFLKNIQNNLYNLLNMFDINNTDIEEIIILSENEDIYEILIIKYQKLSENSILGRRLINNLIFYNDFLLEYLIQLSNLI